MVHEKNKTRGKVEEEKYSLHSLIFIFFAFFIVLAATATFSSSALAVPGNDTTPPTVTSTAPSGTLSSGDVVLKAITDEDAACRYDTSDIAYSVMAYSFDDYGVVHNKSITVPDGSHTYYIRCSDGYGNEMDESALISFAVDSMPPTIIDSFISPSGIVTQDYAVLNVETNEQAICKFSKQDETYDYMDYTFSQTGQTNHSHTLTGLDVGEYTYYIRCKDEHGNKMPGSEVLEFEVKLPPTASISIDGGFRIKIGTHKVTLQTSEEMLSTPALQYQNQGSSGKISMSLTGSGSTWTGYIVVSSATDDRVGTFYFTGQDLSGLSGSEITSGKIFIVDTTKPPAPEDIDAELDDDVVKVEWHYDGEDVDYFNIYRSTADNVDFVDLYEEEVDEEYYKDSDIDEGKTYYYRVTAVDKAGNEGPLSDEVSVKVEPTLEETEPETVYLSSSLEKQLNTTITEVEKDILDIDWAISNLEKMNDPLKVEIITKLDLVNKAKKAKDEVQAALDDLETWRYQDLTKDQFKQKSDTAKLGITRAKTDVATKIDIKNQVEYDQHYDEAALLSTLNDLLINTPLTPEQKKDYQDQSKQFQDQVLIKGKVVSAEIFYMNRENGEALTLFEKSITANEPLQNVLVVESVPKQIEDDASNIQFGTTPVIVKKDPVVKWSFSSISNEAIYYFITGDVDLNIAQTTHTFVFPQVPSSSGGDSEAEGTNKDNGITGNAVDGQEKPPFNLNHFLIGLGIVVIIGLLVYYFYFMKIEEDYEDMAVESKADLKKNTNLVYSLVTKARDWFKPQVQIMPSEKKGNAKIEQGIKTKIEEKQEKTKEKPDPYFHHSLEKAHFIADNLEFDEAFKIYQGLLDSFQKSKLPPQESIMIEKGMNKLHSKLMLLSEIREAHRCVDKQDIIRLNHIKDQIKPLLELVREDGFETKLVKHSVDSYKYFQEASNGMDYFVFK